MLLKDLFIQGQVYMYCHIRACTIYIVDDTCTTAREGVTM